MTAADWLLASAAALAVLTALVWHLMVEVDE